MRFLQGDVVYLNDRRGIFLNSFLDLALLQRFYSVMFDDKPQTLGNCEMHRGKYLLSESEYQARQFPPNTLAAWTKAIHAQMSGYMGIDPGMESKTPQIGPRRVCGAYKVKYARHSEWCEVKN